MTRKFLAALLLSATAGGSFLLLGDLEPFKTSADFLGKLGGNSTGSTASRGTAVTAEAPPPEVPVAEVVVRRVAPVLEFAGHVAAARTVEVRPRVGGFLKSVTVPEGQTVEAGQTLFEIDRRRFEAARDQAAAQLAQAEARLSQAEAAFSRAEQLVKKGVSPLEQLDDAESLRRQRHAEVQLASAALRAADIELSDTRVIAPISGRVDRAWVTEGNLVADGSAGQGTLLTTIVSVDPVHVDFAIDEAAYLALTRTTQPVELKREDGLRVRIEIADGAGFSREGRLDFLATKVDPATGTIKARAVVANPDGRLTPGLFARVLLEAGEERETVLVDDRAIGVDQGRRYVLVLASGNTVEYRLVEIGPIIGGLRSVQAGLEAGESIIVKGLVRPGMSVTPRKVAMGERQPDLAGGSTDAVAWHAPAAHKR